MSNGIPGTEKKGMNPLWWVAIGCAALVFIAGIAVVAVGGFAMFKAKSFVEETAKDFEANPAKAAAELIVRTNPELDLVSSDDEAGTMTIRNNANGEEVTVSFDDLAEGKFSWSTSEGEFSVDASEAEAGGGITFSGPDGEASMTTDESGAVTFTGPDGTATFQAGSNLENLPEWVPLYPEATSTEGTFNMATEEGVTGALAMRTTDSAEDVIAHYKDLLEGDGYTVTVNTSTTNGVYSGYLSAEKGDAGQTLVVGAAPEGDETSVSVQYNARKQ